METPKAYDLVKKDNRLVNAIGKLSTQEQRVLAYAISQVPVDAKEFITNEFEAKHFAEFFGLDSSNCYRELPGILKQLRSRAFMVEGEDERGQYIDILGWFESARYRKKEGTFQIRLTQELKPYLIKLRDSFGGFTSYKIKNIVDFKSSFSFKLYDLLKQYQKIGKRKFDLNEFKEKMGVDGKYGLFANLQKKVIDVAATELNKFSDIKVEWDIITGQKRKIVGLTFYITANKNTMDKAEAVRAVAKKALGPSGPPKNPAFAEMVHKEFGVAQEQADHVARLWEGRELEGTRLLARIKVDWMAGKVKKSLGGYAFQVLKDEAQSLPLPLV